MRAPALQMFTRERGQLQSQKDGTWASTYGWTGRALFEYGERCAEQGLLWTTAPPKR